MTRLEDYRDFVVRGPRANAETSRDGRHGHHCHAPGCRRSTREGKPYCSDHVSMLDYAQKVLSEIEKHEAQVARVRKRPGSARTEDQVAEEIVLILRVNGDRTVPRLARDLREDKTVIDAYVRALAKKKLVSLGKTARGERLVRLAG